MSVTIESINKDLEKFQRKFGSVFILTLCASLIKEHYDMNWNKIKSGILHDPELIIIEMENLKTKIGATNETKRFNLTRSNAKIS